MMGLAFLCGCTMRYDYDLVRIREITDASRTEALDLNKTREEFFRIEVLAMPKETLLGAVIKNGPPYKGNICVSSNIGKVSRLVGLEIYRLDKMQQPIPVDTKTNLNQNWHELGAIWCINEAFMFTDTIEGKTIFRVDLMVNRNGKIEIQKTYFDFVRDIGKGEMSPQDVINQ